MKIFQFVSNNFKSSINKILYINLLYIDYFIFVS